MVSKLRIIWKQRPKEAEAARRKQRKAAVAPMLGVVSQLCDHRHGYIFRKRIRETEAPGYFDIVEQVCATYNHA